MKLNVIEEITRFSYFCDFCVIRSLVVQILGTFGGWSELLKFYIIPLLNCPIINNKHYDSLKIYSKMKSLNILSVNFSAIFKAVLSVQVKFPN